MEAAVNQDQLLKRLDVRWQEFRAAFAGLSDEAVLTPGVTGTWSARDLISHVATWDEEALKALPMVLEDKPLPRYASIGEIDSFNAREQWRKRGMTLDEVVRDMETTHRRLLSFLRIVPPAAYASEGRFVKRLRLDSYGNYRKHAAGLLSWRKSRGL